MMFSRTKKSLMVEPADALPGRGERPFRLTGRHAVNGNALFAPYPDGFEQALVGMGCFWGAERLFWEMKGVFVTSVGYGGGFTPNPTYEEVCSGRTGHAELVHIVFDPVEASYAQVLQRFWENHDPTQGMRQGNDQGTQYRSALYTFGDAQAEAAAASKAAFGVELERAGHGTITTELAPAGPYWFAEEDHQQYLHKVPWGYCNLAGTGVACPTGLDRAAAE